MDFSEDLHLESSESVVKRVRRTFSTLTRSISFNDSKGSACQLQDGYQKTQHVCLVAGGTSLAVFDEQRPTKLDEEPL